MIDSTAYQTYLVELTNTDLPSVAETIAVHFWLVEEIKWFTVGTLGDKIKWSTVGTLGDQIKWSTVGTLWDQIK